MRPTNNATTVACLPIFPSSKAGVDFPIIVPFKTVSRSPGGADSGPTTVHGAEGRDIFHSGQGRTVTPMTDARVESFLADVLALEGENPDAIREGVHVALGDCEAIFKAAGSEQTHEGQGGSRLPRPMSCSNRRRHAASERNGNGRALEVRF